MLIFFACGLENSKPSWQIVGELEEGRAGFGAAVYNGKIYIFQGYNDGGAQTPTTLIFDPSTGQLSEAGIPSRSYSGITAVTLGDYIYTLGGYFNQISNSMLKYNPDNDRWSSRTGFNEVRAYAAAAVYAENIYLFGGTADDWEGESGCLNSVECFNSSTGEWEYLPEMTESRCAPCATVLDGKIYVTGGKSGDRRLRSTEVYDPISDTWSSIALMNTGRHHHACAALNGKLYVMGGNQGMDNVEIYDPVTDTWTEGPEMEYVRREAVAVVIDQTIYIISGSKPSAGDVRFNRTIEALKP